MLNAMVEDILCPSCNNTNNFSLERWQNLLEDAFEKINEFKPGEGQPSTVMSGEYTYSLLYGKQEPRCQKCKQNIDTSKIEEYEGQNHIACTKCSNSIYIRKPIDAITGIFPQIKFLIGEDEDLISVNKTGVKPPESARPVLFICPSCAGNLEIDGTDRMVTCKYCNSQIYLPDDLWFRLHPAEWVSRWYILVDEKPPEGKIPGWYYLSDVTIDEEGNLYAATATDGDNDFSVWSISPSLKTRWIKYDLKYNHETAGLTITHDGNLYLWDKRKHSLLKLSSATGEIIEKIQGRPATPDNPNAFNLKGCSTLISDFDGTILALINNTVVRYSSDGRRVNIWNGKKFGIFSSGIGKRIPEDDSEYAPYVKEIGSFPQRVDSDFTKLNMGWDGYLYMIDKSSSDGEVAKYNKDGTQIWSKYIPLQYKDCKACADSNGNVYILGKTNDSNTNLIMYNSSKGNFETLLRDIKEGGVLNDEDLLAVAPKGTIYIMKFYDKLKVFSPDLKMIFRSKQCDEDDNEVLQEKKESIEKDEEFD